MEDPPFVDVFSIGKGEFPLLCYFTGVYMFRMTEVKL